MVTLFQHVAGQGIDLVVAEVDVVQGALVEAPGSLHGFNMPHKVVLDAERLELRPIGVQQMTMKGGDFIG